MDAGLMDGRDLRVGAVASITHVANPIAVARLVMELGPLPDAQRIAIVLIEREGRRVDVCSMASTLATIQ